MIAPLRYTGVVQLARNRMRFARVAIIASLFSCGARSRATRRTLPPKAAAEPAPRGERRQGAWDGRRRARAERRSAGAGRRLEGGARRVHDGGRLRRGARRHRPGGGRRARGHRLRHARPRRLPAARRRQVARTRSAARASTPPRSRRAARPRVAGARRRARRVPLRCPIAPRARTRPRLPRAGVARRATLRRRLRVRVAASPARRSPPTTRRPASGSHCAPIRRAALATRSAGRRPFRRRRRLRGGAPARHGERRPSATWRCAVDMIARRRRRRSHRRRARRRRLLLGGGARASSCRRRTRARRWGSSSSCRSDPKKAHVDRLDVEQPGKPGDAHRGLASAAALTVTVSKFEKRRGGAVELIVDGPADEAAKFHAEVTTFVRDVVKPSALLGDRRDSATAGSCARLSSGDAGGHAAEQGGRRVRRRHARRARPRTATARRWSALARGASRPARCAP